MAYHEQNSTVSQHGKSVRLDGPPFIEPTQKSPVEADSLAGDFLLRS